MRFAARLLLLPFVLLFGATFCGCNTLKDEGRTALGNVIDCTTSTALKAVDEYGPATKEALVSAARGDGSLDTDRAKAVLKSYTSDAARCVAAATFQQLVRAAMSSPDAPQSSPLFNPVSLERAWQELRTTQFGGATFKLASSGSGGP